MPLRNLHTHPRSDQASRAIEPIGRLTMILDHILSRTAGSKQLQLTKDLTRRGFLQAGSAAGGGLILTLRLPFAKGEAGAADTDRFEPNAFIRIDRDGRVVLTMPYVEMGQG